MSEEKYTQLILSELAGEIDQKEQQALQSWVKSAPEHLKEYETVKKLWAISEPVDSPLELDVDHEFKRFKARIQAPTTPIRTIGRPASRSNWLKAAAILLLVSTGIWLFNPFGQQDASTKWVSVATQMDKEVITLPDNSTIWLNKHSELSYPVDFSKRVVRLKGEAYFDVEKKNGENFVIQAGSTKTEVLGTTFNVRAYQVEPIVEVVVFSGKVSFEALEDEQKEVILRPKDKGVYTKTDQKVEKKHSNDPNVLAWKDGQLRFSGQSLQEIIPMIEGFYNIKIETSNSAILQCAFTGNFDQVKAKDLMESIAFGLSLELNIQKGSYQLSGKGCR